MPLEVREKFASLWAACAFAPTVSTQDRYLHLVQMMIEGENGFWAYNVHTRCKQFVVCCFGLYDADMAEVTKAVSATDKTGNAYIQCNRCGVDKENLCNPDYPIDATLMTHELRLHAYEQASVLKSPSARAAYLSRQYGLKPTISNLIFSASLRAPDQFVSDLLHNWGINSPAWTITVVWHLLNIDGKKVLSYLLKSYGSAINNTFENP
jgi:hypothetical protein